MKNTKLNIFVFIFTILIVRTVLSAGGGANKGVYKVLDSVTKVPCIILQADIYLYLTYVTNDGSKDTTVHVPVTSTVDSASSCDTIVTTSGLSVKSQLLRINLDHMSGWTLDLAFTKDNTFKTNSGSQYTLFQVNVTANFASDPTTFPGAKDAVQNYYLHVDPVDLSEISGSIYADAGHSYYCPSKQKYAINNNDKYGSYAYIMFQLTTLQAYKTTNDGFGEKETCPSDQHVTDIIPIIVGSCLAGLIVITLVIYLIYRSCLPEEVLNLVNPESHFNYENGIKVDADEESTEIHY